MRRRAIGHASWLLVVLGATLAACSGDGVSAGGQAAPEAGGLPDAGPRAAEAGISADAGWEASDPQLDTCGDAGSDAGSAASICSCTPEQAEDATGFGDVAISFTNKYTPRCLAVSAGATVTWSGYFLAHPLWPSACAGDVDDNPIHDVADPLATSLSITFAEVGTFPYYCPNHANDGRSPTGMCGVVYVRP